MSKLFASSSPFSQATYSPLRNSQDLGHDDDDPDSSNSSSGAIRHHYHSPQLNHHQQQQRRQFRHRSPSQSSSRSILSMSDQLQHSLQQNQQHQQQHPTTFAQGEDDSEGDASPIPHQIGSTGTRISLGSVISGSAASPTSRRSSAIRPLSSQTQLSHAHNAATTATAIQVDSASGIDSEEDCDDPSSPPPKYTPEDLEYSEPARLSYGRDEEGGLHMGYHRGEDGQGDGLLMQASTTLVIAVSGLICAGWLLDVIQHWQVFVDISELIILIPILLNLKGNLEMNLASRLSTAANMGLLDQHSSRNAFIKGNLALLQVQSLAVGSVAGLFSFGLGVIVHPTNNNFNEIALMITASMLCAAMSSFVLGGFMCGLVLVCRRYRINPDNIACPLASSFGDLVTLVILAGCAVVLQNVIDTAFPAILLVFLLGLIPAWTIYVRRNKFVSEVAKEGWVPVFAAMVIASTAGLTLERYINDFPGMALISPVLNGLMGNIGSIYASRISTSLHVNIKETYRATERTLFFVHIPIQVVFLIIIGALGLGHIHWSVPVVLGYSAVALCLVVITLAMAKYITHTFWKWGYDPDNYALPILTSLIDVIGTALLVAGFWALQYGKFD